MSRPTGSDALIMSCLAGLSTAGAFLAAACAGSLIFTLTGLTRTMHLPAAELTLLAGLSAAILLWFGVRITAVSKERP